MKKLFQSCIYKKLFILIFFIFLYLPILVLIIYSFNESKLMMTWKGFSFHWYLVLFQDHEMISAIMFSFYIASITATTAIIMGTMISFITVRFKNFFGFNFFYFMFTGILIMPDIVNGLSLLLLFVTMNNMFNWPGNNGVLTIWLAHTTFCTAYVTVLINARLKEQDNFIEEAAINLGARPIKVFIFIILPAILPAILAGWLLSFSLSLDDLVIASFVTKPGTITLPMQIFSMVRRGVSPEINALSSIILFVISILVFFIWKILVNSKQLSFKNFFYK